MEEVTSVDFQCHTCQMKLRHLPGATPAVGHLAGARYRPDAFPPSPQSLRVTVHLCPPRLGLGMYTGRRVACHQPQGQ